MDYYSPKALDIFCFIDYISFQREWIVIRVGFQ